MQFKTLAAAALAGTALAQNTTSPCDKYAAALFTVSNATTQYTLLTALVNTVVIGNYSASPMNAVPGILANGTVNGKTVSLLQYFDGALLSTNRGGKAVSLNFLDDGGAVPLMMNKPANGTSSNQYKLLTHLYSYFGALLGCSAYGDMGFPAYEGVVSQYTVHKFMALEPEEITWFIMNVGLAATSFGVTTEDATAVGTTLNTVFNAACEPAMALLPNTDPVLNSMCLGEDCPLAMNSNCTAYDTTNSNGTQPEPSTVTATATSTATTTSTTTASPGAAVANKVGYAGLIAVVLAAFAL